MNSKKKGEMEKLNRWDKHKTNGNMVTFHSNIWLHEMQLDR